jgi:hypothetical protein
MSFSQEMKDFLTAYKSGTDINAKRTTQDYQEAQQDALTKKTARENDPDQLELEDKQARAKLALTQGQLGHLAAQAAYTNALAKRIGTGAVGDPLATGYLPPTGAVGPQGPIPQGQGAIPLPPVTMDNEAYANGGLVKAYAGGGVLDADSDTSEPDNDPDDVPGGIPTPADAPTDISAARRAVMGGMTYGANAYGLTGTGAIKTPAQMQKARMLAEGHGGLSDAEMEAARNAVDPQKQLPEGQRNIAALGTVYQYWANRNEPEKANKVAFQMLQHYRAASTRYAAIAAKAAEGGDMDLATKAALKAYANVPDGNDIHIEASPDNPKQLIYYYTDSKGNELAKGVATPEQLASSAMGLARGGFDKALMTAAGQDEAKGAVGGGKPPTAAEKTGQEKLAAGPVKAMKDAWQAKNPDTPVDEEMWTQAHDVAQHIMQQNPNTTGNEAARAAHLLINPGTKDPEKPDFKVTSSEDGVNSVQFGNGTKVKLDDDQLNAIMNSRAARIKQATDKINTDMEAQDKPDRLGQAMEGAGQVARGVVNAAPTIANPGAAVASKAVDALRSIYGEHIPQSVLDAVEATKGAIGGAASRVAGAIGDATSNSGAVPVSSEDRPI